MIQLYYEDGGYPSVRRGAAANSSRADIQKRIGPLGTREARQDSLRAARGIILGCLLGSGIWLVLGLVAAWLWCGTG